MTTWLSIADCKRRFPFAFELTYPPLPRLLDPENDSKLKYLPYYNTVFLVDDSMSMLMTRNSKQVRKFLVGLLALY